MTDEILNGYEEDSDEVLNLPSLWMNRRVRGPAVLLCASLCVADERTSLFKRQSLGATESVGTSHRLVGRTGRAFNSRIYFQNCSALIGVDVALSSVYLINGSLGQIARHNLLLVDEVVRSANKQLVTTWLVSQTWASLSALAEAGRDGRDLPLFSGGSLSEKLVLDIFDIFQELGDVQMLGMLSCIVESDRRGV